MQVSPKTTFDKLFDNLFEGIAKGVRNLTTSGGSVAASLVLLTIYGYNLNAAPLKAEVKKLSNEPDLMQVAVKTVDYETQLHYSHQTNPVYAPGIATVILGMVDATHTSPTIIGSVLGLDQASWKKASTDAANALHAFGKMDGCGSYACTFLTGKASDHEQLQMQQVAAQYGGDSLYGTPVDVTQKINDGLAKNNITLKVDEVKDNGCGCVVGVKLKTEWNTKFNTQDNEWSSFNGSEKPVEFLVQKFKGGEEAPFDFGVYKLNDKFYDVVRKKGNNGVDVYLIQTEDNISFEPRKVRWQKQLLDSQYTLKVPQFNAKFQDKNLEEWAKKFGATTILGYPISNGSLQAEFEFTAEGAKGQAVMVIQGVRCIISQENKEFVFDSTFRWWACTPDGVPVLAGCVNDASCMK